MRIAYCVLRVACCTMAHHWSLLATRYSLLIAHRSSQEGCMAELPAALIALNPYEARTAAAIFDRLFPADAYSLGAVAIGVVTYLDRALAGPYRDKNEVYRVGLATLDRVARVRC